MSTLAQSFRRGDPMIWLTGSALGICMLMITGLILVILFNGLSFFWPQKLVQLKLKDGSVLLGRGRGARADPQPGPARPHKKAIASSCGWATAT